MRRFGVALAGGLALALVLGLSAIGWAAKGGSADLAITKTDSPDPVGVGATLTYAIGVQDLGPDAASGVTVTDQLPKGVDFVSATSTAGSCARKGRKVTCALGSIGTPAIDYAPTSVTIDVVPRKAGTITNTASVKGSEKDPVGANNRATATTTVTAPATCRGVPATIIGTAGDDHLVGTPGRDVIVAFQGDDTIASLGGRDLICAGAGADRVGAGSAADRVFGGAGRDRLLGRGGPDVLKGGPGRDVLKGGRGADRLRGGPGRDRCRGGAGADSLRSCER
jgi:uncharacterized repeat protein (TIGR01451 family)